MVLPKNGLLKFYAEWCAPCRAITPLVKKAASDQGVELLEVDIDENPDLAQQFNVRSIPMVVVLRDGEPVDASVGAFGEDHYVALAQKVLEKQ